MERSSPSRHYPRRVGSVHATGHAVVGQEELEWLTSVLASSTGVMQHGLRLASPPDGHHECIGDQLRGHRRLDRPADDPSREEIHHRGDVEPAFDCPEIDEVGDPFAVRRRVRERPVEHIRRGGVRRRLGRARNAACRMIRSIRCRQQDTPSTNRLCQHAALHKCGHWPGSWFAPSLTAVRWPSPRHSVTESSRHKSLRA